MRDDAGETATERTVRLPVTRGDDGLAVGGGCARSNTGVRLASRLNGARAANIASAARESSVHACPPRASAGERRKAETQAASRGASGPSSRARLDLSAMARPWRHSLLSTRALVLLLLVICALGWSRHHSRVRDVEPSAVSASEAAPEAPAKPQRPGTQPRAYRARFVAVGDLHGDLEHALRVLRMVRCRIRTGLKRPGAAR